MSSRDGDACAPYRDRPNRGGEAGAGGLGNTRLVVDRDDVGGGGNGSRTELDVEDVIGEPAPFKCDAGRGRDGNTDEMIESGGDRSDDAVLPGRFGEGEGKYSRLGSCCASSSPTIVVGPP